MIRNDDASVELSSDEVDRLIINLENIARSAQEAIQILAEEATRTG